MNILIVFYDDNGIYGEATILTVESLNELLSTLNIMKSTGNYTSYTLEAVDEDFTRRFNDDIINRLRSNWSKD